MGGLFITQRVRSTPSPSQAALLAASLKLPLLVAKAEAGYEEGTAVGRVRASAQSTRAKAAAFLEWRPPNTRVERYGARASRLQF